MELDVLIKKCIKKDRQAQEELYTTYKIKLFPVCLKYCSSYAEAEDHLHDVFITIFDALQNYTGKGSFEGWMKRIAIYKAIDKYKKNKTVDLNQPENLSQTEAVFIDEGDIPPSLEILMNLIQQLPTQYRMVFNLFELDGYTHKEISKMLGISASTSKSNLHRAKVILKDKVRSYNVDVSKRKNSHGH